MLEGEGSCWRVEFILEGGGDRKRESPDFGCSGWHLWVCNKQPRLEWDLRGKLL